MNQAKSPDRAEQFDDIVRRTHVRIRAYIAGMGIASHAVDDVAQDVYLEYFRNMDKAPAEVEPERWLKGIARNLCLNHIRRHARRARLHREAISELLAKIDAPSERLTSQRPVQYALEGCYEKLPDQSRRLLAMRYEQDLPSHSIAESLNSTAEAIRVSLYRIRAALRDCMNSSLAKENG